MGDGPSDDDIRRAERAAEKQKQTAEAMSPYVEANKLNPELLKHVLDKFAPDNDAADDGVYAQPWMATDTFYRFTEEYVVLEQRLAFKMALESAFPGKKHGR
jgi:hypothetical protein